MKSFVTAVVLCGSAAALFGHPVAPFAPPLVRWELRVHGIDSFESLIQFERDLQGRFPGAGLRLVSSSLVPGQPGRSQAVWQVSAPPSDADPLFSSVFRVGSFTASFSGHELQGWRVETWREGAVESGRPVAGPRGFE